MSTKMVTAIILAGGLGSRMKSSETKQNIVILGETVLERTLKAFAASSMVNDIIVVARDEETDTVSTVIESLSICNACVVVGGETRANSAKNGFSAVKYSNGFVAIHDCARCLVTPEMIDKVILSAFENGAATAVCAVTDTVKLVDSDGMIKTTLPREKIYRAQTPQVFSTEIYKRALESIGDKISEVTDDNMLVESIGVKIACVDLGQENIKITTREDLDIAEFILQRRGKHNV